MGSCSCYKGVWHTNSHVRVVPRGPTWRRYIDQLRPRYGVNEDTDPGEDPRPTSTNGMNEHADPRNILQRDSTDGLQDAEGTNTSDHTPTLTPNPLESTDCTSQNKQRKQRRRKARLPPPDAEYGPHNPRRSERLQSRK